MNGGLSDFDSPDSMRMELNLESPTNGTFPFNGTYSESGVYSRESMRSPPSPTPYIKKKSVEAAAPKSTLRPARLLSAPYNDVHGKRGYATEGMAGSSSNFQKLYSFGSDFSTQLIDDPLAVHRERLNRQLATLS